MATFVAQIIPIIQIRFRHSCVLYGFCLNRKTAISALRVLHSDNPAVILYRKRRNFCWLRCFFYGKRRYFRNYPGYFHK